MKSNELPLTAEQLRKLLVTAALLRIWTYRYRLRDWSAGSEKIPIYSLFEPVFREDESRPELLILSINTWEILAELGWKQQAKSSVFGCPVLRAEHSAGAIRWAGVISAETQSYLEILAGDDADAALQALQSALAEAGRWQHAGAAAIAAVSPTIAAKLTKADGNFMLLGQSLTPVDIAEAERVIKLIHPPGIRGEFRLAKAAGKAAA